MKLLSIHPATPVTEGPQAGFPLVFDFWSVEPKPPRERTEVVVRYDESGLQFSFRCLDALENFCRIRGYVSTARKNSLTALNALRRLFLGDPFLPTPNSS